MSRRSILLLLAVGLFASACTVGPDYRRPDVTLPTTYRGADSSTAAPATAVALADVAWWKCFDDPDLQALIRTALTENQDLQIAVTRILQAQSQYTQTRSSQFPALDAQADAPYNKYTDDRPPTLARESFSHETGLSLSWELDLWGKFRRGTEASRAQMLASEEVRNAVVVSLVSQVAQSYFTLRTYDLDLEISKRTVASRQQSVDLVNARLEGGVAMVLDLQQAETLLYTATKTIPDIERRIEQTENLLCILLGKDPGPIPRGKTINQQIASPTVPTGLPSEILSRRPDIRQAEQQLIAANALIGVAEAQRYPQLSLSGFAGIGGFTIDGDSYSPTGVFSALPFLKLPIFNAGALKAGVDRATYQTQEAALRYKQTILQALREVSDGLVGVRKSQEFKQQQEILTKTLAEASAVSKMRYEGGVSSYLEVLDTERQYFQSELDLTQAQRDELGSLVELYRALGGGWQATDAGPEAPQG
jgi:multidrug efflux system outer membrane protein